MVDNVEKKSAQNDQSTLGEYDLSPIFENKSLFTLSKSVYKSKYDFSDKNRLFKQLTADSHSLRMQAESLRTDLANMPPGKGVPAGYVERASKQVEDIEELQAALNELNRLSPGMR